MRVSRMQFFPTVLLKFSFLSGDSLYHLGLPIDLYEMDDKLAFKESDITS